MSLGARSGFAIQNLAIKRGSTVVVKESIRRMKYDISLCFRPSLQNSATPKGTERKIVCERHRVWREAVAPPDGGCRQNWESRDPRWPLGAKAYGKATQHDQ